MRKYIGALAVLALAAMPVVAQAATFVARQEYASGPSERLAGNLYVAGGTVSVGSSVGGDLMAAGGNITVTGAVGQDVAAVGGTVQLLGPVNGDARISGGQLMVSGRVSGDLLAAGGTVHLLPGAVVQGDLYATGGQVILDGTVQGSVHMSGGQLTVNGTINGALTYHSSKLARIAPDARIGGPVTYEPTGIGAERAPRAVLWMLVGVLTAMRMLMFLGMAALIVWRWRRQALAVMQEAMDGFWPHTGRGLAFAVLIPLAAVLLLMSFIGTIAGGLLLLAYVAGIAIAKVLAGMFLGAWLSALIAKRQVLHITWANALGGTILIQLLTLLPVIGWIVQILAFLSLFGVLAERARKQLALR